MKVEIHAYRPCDYCGRQLTYIMLYTGTKAYHWLHTEYTGNCKPIQ